MLEVLQLFMNMLKHPILSFFQPVLREGKSSRTQTFLLFASPKGFAFVEKTRARFEQVNSSELVCLLPSGCVLLCTGGCGAWLLHDSPTAKGFEKLP